MPDSLTHFDLYCPKRRTLFVPFLGMIFLFACPGLAGSQTTDPIGEPKDAAESLVSAWSTARYTFQPVVHLTAPTPTEQSAASMPYAVAIGDWAFVAHQLQLLAPPDALRVYNQILRSLNEDKSAGSSLQATPSDVFALSETLPANIDLPESDLPRLGELLAVSLKRQSISAQMLSALEGGTPHLGGTDPVKRVRLGELLFLAGKPTLAVRYLPSADDAIEHPQSPVALLVYRNTLAAVNEADAGGDPVSATRLRKAALSLAIARLKTSRASIGLDPLVDDIFSLCESTGDIRSLTEWIGDLEQSDSPHLNQALLALGKMPPPTEGNLKTRVNALSLQREVAVSLLNGDHAKLAARSPRQLALELFAANWMTEAAFTRSTFSMPRPLQRGSQTSGTTSSGAGESDAISSQQLLLLRPTNQWLDTLRAESQLSFQRTLIPIAMNADEVDLALSSFHPVARELPDSLDTLGGEALTIWAHKHETHRIIGINADQQPVAVGIPLTRRGQDRNIEKLASILNALDKTYGRPLSRSQLPVLFTMIYSQAEVFRLSDIQAVFGPLENLDTDTTLALATLMRTNLETTWQDPNIQNAFGTGLDAEEIAAKVSEGYGTLISVLQKQSDVSHDYRVVISLRLPR